MNLQLRLFVILLGAVLVAFTFTFPLWQPFLTQTIQGNEVFPGLPPSLVEPFQLLPVEERNALIALSEENQTLAVTLARAALIQDNPIPEEEQSMPEMDGPQIISGDFVSLSPVLGAEGIIQIFERADGTRLLRVEELNVTNLNDLQVVLSGNAEPLTTEAMQQDGLFIELGLLQGNIGSQNFEIAAEIDLSRYNSVALYSQSLELVVSYAPFTGRFS